MGYTRIPTAAFAIGKALSMTVLMKIRNNFSHNEDRIANLEASPTIFPTGSIHLYGGSSAPSGFLICNGDTVSRTTYADLFAIVGTTFNIGGEAGTVFRLPDHRSRHLIGAGAGSGLTSRALADKVGAETHTLTSAEMPSHTHAVTDPNHAHTTDSGVNTGGVGVPTDFANSAVFVNGNTNFNVVDSATTGVTLANTGGGGAHANMQPFLGLNVIIKT